MWFRRRPRENRSGEEANLALEDALGKLQETRERSKEVEAVVKAHKELQGRNHFAEQLEEIILGRRGTAT